MERPFEVVKSNKRNAPGESGAAGDTFSVKSARSENLSKQEKKVAEISFEEPHEVYSQQDFYDESEEPSFEELDIEDASEEQSAYYEDLSDEDFVSLQDECFQQALKVLKFHCCQHKVAKQKHLFKIPGMNEAFKEIENYTVAIFKDKFKFQYDDFAKGEGYEEKRHEIRQRHIDEICNEAKAFLRAVVKRIKTQVMDTNILESWGAEFDEAAKHTIPDDHEVFENEITITMFPKNDPELETKYRTLAGALFNSYKAA